MKSIIDCTSGNIRLVGGSDKYEGRVEVCVKNQWGTVCDDSWDIVDVHVVCRQLGYSTNNSARAFYSAYFGEGSGLIHLDDVSCEGEESSLFNCKHKSDHNCGHYKDAGVRCGKFKTTFIHNIIIFI